MIDDISKLDNTRNTNKMLIALMYGELRVS